MLHNRRKFVVKKHNNVPTVPQTMTQAAGLDESQVSRGTMTTSTERLQNMEDETPSISPAPFQPMDRTASVPSVQLPYELWLTVLEASCTFPPSVFANVMLSLIKNPNITSSHLFRADILYDSERDYTIGHRRMKLGLAGHLKQEHRPIEYELPGHVLSRTIVRQMIPRNPQLDRPLVQTCHFFNKLEDEKEHNVLLYLPHEQTAQDMPFYHPAVSRLAFIHKWKSSNSDRLDLQLGSASVSISYCLYEGTTLTNKLERTALRLLETIHKHGQGQLAGYEKRVHLDQIIPQKRYQDTYARLKAKYGKPLAEQWVEVTDPGKHVFEDIAIAAFLIELWRDMYQIPGSVSQSNGVNQVEAADGSEPPFPGFVDIGCGNGILVYLLLAEGYEGSGFDARARKTWETFPEWVQQRLQRRLLIPPVFPLDVDEDDKDIWHDGTFAPGTFIISNHADELTTWTPLLAYLNDSAFIAIPCCSHDFTGARYRAPGSVKGASSAPVRLPQQSTSDAVGGAEFPDGLVRSQVAETGSLRRTVAQKKMQSAYSSLCSYVTSLTQEVGYLPETEVLRIPSTRNQCIIGRRKDESVEPVSGREVDTKKENVIALVERELRMSIQSAGASWIERVGILAQKPGSGH